MVASEKLHRRGQDIAANVSSYVRVWHPEGGARPRRSMERLLCPLGWFTEFIRGFSEGIPNRLTDGNEALVVWPTGLVDVGNLRVGRRTDCRPKQNTKTATTTAISNK